MDLITAQPLPATSALSFWPPDVADAIASYQAQLASTAPLAASAEPGNGPTPRLREPAELAAAHQQHPPTAETVTAHHAATGAPGGGGPQTTTCTITAVPPYASGVIAVTATDGTSGSDYQPVPGG